MKFNKIIVFCIMLFLCAYSVNADLTTNINSYWKFDENTGTTAGDSISTNDGTINGATWTTGKINYGLDFNINTDYVSVTTLPLKNDIGAGDFTLSTWIKPDILTGALHIYWAGSDTAYANMFLFRLNGDKFETYFRPSTSGGTAITGTTSLSTGQWYMLTAVREGTTVTMYINGNLEKTVTSADIGMTIGTSTSHTEIWGKAPFTTTNSYNGIIDEPAIWSRTLNSTEITDLYNSGAGFQYPFISSSLEFESITVNDENLTNTSYYNVSVLNFDVDVLNTSTNTNINQTYYLYNSSNDLVQTSQYATNNQNGTFTLSGLPNDIYQIYFYAVNNETSVTSSNYTFEMNVSKSLDILNISINNEPLISGKYYNTTDLNLYLELTNISTNGNANVTYLINGYTPEDNQFITNGLNGTINFTHSYNLGNANKYVRFATITENGRPLINGKKIIYNGVVSLPYNENETGYNYCNKYLGSTYQVSSNSQTSDSEAYYWDGTDFQLKTGLTLSDFINVLDCEIFGGDFIYNITLFANNGEVNTTKTYDFTIDTTTPIINHNIPTEINSYSWDNININVTDTNKDTCIFNIENTNYSCASFTSHTFTTNGNKTWTIYAKDLAGNTETETGTLLINPYQYYRFYDFINSNYTQNYIFGGYSSIGDYVKIPVYDLGLGVHSLQFYKLGYNASYYDIEFTNTSNINKTFNVTPVRIEIRIYDQLTNLLINTVNISLDLIGITNLNATSNNGIFNITSYVAPDDYQVFVSADGYISNQLSFTYTSIDLIKENMYLIPSNYSLSGYVNIITYNKDNTYASEINVIAYEWDSVTSSFKETYKTQSDTNGKAVMFIILQNRIYKFCAEYPTGTTCFPSGTNGQIIPISQNGDTFPILPVLNFPQLSTSFEDLDFGIATNLTNYTSGQFNYSIDYLWNNRNGLSTTICTRLVKDYNYTKEEIMDNCLTQPSGEYIHTFLLNNSFSYILTVYQKIGDQEINLYSERVNGSDTFWDALDYFNIKNLFVIVLLCLMLGAIPFLKNSFLIIGDLILILFVLWQYIIPQSLSITSVGVLIVMGVITLWGLKKK